MFSSLLSVISFYDPDSTWLVNEVADSNINATELQLDLDKQFFDPLHRPSQRNAGDLYLVSVPCNSNMFEREFED